MSAFQLTDEQRQLLLSIGSFLRSERQLYTFFGYAGTGKTTCLASIAQSLPDAVVLAPTHRAAKVLASKIGRKVQTIHSFLYVPNGAAGWTPKLAAGRLAGEILLVDEVSMLDTSITADLISTGAKIIFAGDPAQLPPVKGTPGITRADWVLDEVIRQSADSPITRAAHRVREGADLRDLVEFQCPDFQILQNIDVSTLAAADMAICHTNEARRRVVTEIRQARGLVGFPKGGEPLMARATSARDGIRNGGEHRVARDATSLEDVWIWDRNGRPGEVKGAVYEGSTKRDGTIFALDYARTVHSAQGSEFPHVVIVDDCRDETIRRNWLYTAITRAKEQLTIFSKRIH